MYVLVLGLSVLVAAIGVGATATVRLRNRTANLEDAIGDARAYAWSATELGRLEMSTNPSWRTQHRNDANGEWFTSRAFDRGTITLKVTNPAGALDRADTDGVVLTATGVRGPARQMAQVTLTANPTAMACLDSAAFAAAGVAFGSATITGAGLVSSNGNVTGTNAKVALNVESAAQVSGANYNAVTRNGVPIRTFPTTAVFDYYKANGTTIAYTSFPVITTGRGINATLLSPASNPFGVTNGKGIYVVDCGGRDFIVKSARIVGTLVLLNAGANTAIQTNVNWQPAVANHPCLLVQGPLSLGFNATAMSEAGIKVNFNPAGTPYPWGTAGATDTDMIDSYPSTVEGLVYASGSVSASGAPSVQQLIAGGTLSTVGTLTLNYVSTYQLNPPPGFYQVKMTVSPGSWKAFSN